MATDPNYNPGFFGWLWDGIKNPLQALNTFENTHLVPLAEKTDAFLKPVTNVLDAVANSNPLAAQVMQNGAGWSSQTGAHIGMQAPTGAPSGYDPTSSVDPAIQAQNARQMPLTAPGATPITSNPLASPMNPSLGTSGGGWNSNSVAMPSDVKTMYDGTKYTTSVVNGKTVYNIVDSRKAASGTQLDDANFANLLNGRPAVGVNGSAVAPTPAPVAPPPAPVPQIPDVSKIVTDPAVIAGASGVVGAVTSGAAANTAANAATEAARLQAEAAQKAVQLQEDMFNSIREDQAPWRAAGGRALHNLENFEQFDPAWSMDKFQQDPGYTFRLSEGMKALQNSAAGRGGLLSGNTLKSIQNYGQEAASQEYNNAYNRYTTERNQRRNSLQSLAGVGQTVNQQVASAGQSYANNAGNFMVSGGNALAQGQSNAANANASGWMGTGNALINAIGTYYNQKNGQDIVNALRGGQ